MVKPLGYGVRGGKVKQISMEPHAIPVSLPQGVQGVGCDSERGGKDSQFGWGVTILPGIRDCLLRKVGLDRCL